MSLSVSGDVVTVEPLELQSMGNDIYLGSLDLEVSFMKARQEVAEQYSTDEMAKNFANAFNGLIFSVGQMLVFDFHGQNLKAIVKGMFSVRFLASVF